MRHSIKENENRVVVKGEKEKKMRNEKKNRLSKKMSLSTEFIYYFVENRLNCMFV